MNKTTLKRITLTFSSLVISLVLLEIVLRFLNIPMEINKEYQRRDIEWMEKNVDLNSAGYRDKEYSEEKTPGDLRIYSLGDSYTYGWLVDNFEDTYPKILESKLNEKGIKTEVINAGNPGYSLPEMLKRFSNEGKYYYPDVVVLGINDDEANYSKTYEQPKDSKLTPILKSLHLYQLTFGNYFRYAAEKNNHKFVLDIYNDLDSQEWKNTTKQLLKLKDETNKINAKLAIVLFPHIHPNRPDDRYDYQPYNDRFQQFGKENGIVIIDPLEDFLSYQKKSELVINPIDPHPTAAMNRIVAESFVKQFDVDGFLKTHQVFTPEIKTAILTPDNPDLGQYQSIKEISSSFEGYPWVYFETKYGNDIQNFALKDKSFRNSKIYLDNLQTAKTFTHSALPGATIIYHVYPKESGKIFIPGNIYNFEVIGLNHIFAMEVLADGTTRGDYISPSSVIKDSSGLNIQFYKDNPYHVFRLNLKVAVKQADITPEGKIENLVKTYLIKTISPEKSPSVSLPFSNEPALSSEKKISSWAEFSGEDTKAYTYAFVDGKMTTVKEVKVESDRIILTFGSSIGKGQEVEFPVMAGYQLEEGENIEVVFE